VWRALRVLGMHLPVQSNAKRYYYSPQYQGYQYIPHAYRCQYGPHVPCSGWLPLIRVQCGSLSGRRSDMYQPLVASAPQAFYNTSPGAFEVNAAGIPFGFFHLPLQGAQQCSHFSGLNFSLEIKPSFGTLWHHGGADILEFRP
jgi:hypothetical protein